MSDNSLVDKVGFGTALGNDHVNKIWLCYGMYLLEMHNITEWLNAATIMSVLSQK